LGIVIVGAGMWLGVGLVRDMITPPAPTHYGPRYDPVLAVVVTVVVWFLLAVLNGIGVLLSAGGGLGGGAAAQWLTQARMESRSARRDE
jgi:hypothetical protein